MVDFWNDPVMLAAGNARGLPGGDPDTIGGDLGGAIPGRGTLIPHPYIPDLTTLTGDLNAHADRLGIPVDQLVQSRIAAQSGRSRLIDVLIAVRERFSR